MRNKLKFKKLLNEYRSLKFELKFVEDVLSEYHLEFEKTYRVYCAEKEIDLQKLHEQNKERVDQIFPQYNLIETNEATEDKKPEQTKHKKIYRELAKKLHPDSLPEGDDRYDEYNKAFQQAAQAHNDGAWGDLFDLVEHYDINFRDYVTICNSLVEDIDRITLEINNHKKTFSWALYECEQTEDCEEMVMKNFLMTVFRYRV